MIPSSLRTQQGFTLTELMVTIVIAAIAFFALAMPFVAERSFWNTGINEVQAQRDAHMAVHAIARAARDGSSATVVALDEDMRLILNRPCGNMTFESNNGAFQLTNACVSPSITTTLIDGVNSRVVEFTPSSVTSRLLSIRMNVMHQNERNEILETRIFLRNAA